MTDPTHPIAVGVAVAAHVSGTWTWSVHTDATRWCGNHPDARQVSDLAPHILDQIHDRLDEQVCIVDPPELGLALPTGREETLRRAAEHARRPGSDHRTPVHPGNTPPARRAPPTTRPGVDGERARRGGR